MLSAIKTEEKIEIHLQMSVSLTSWQLPPPVLHSRQLLVSPGLSKCSNISALVFFFIGDL